MLFPLSPMGHSDTGEHGSHDETTQLNDDVSNNYIEETMSAYYLSCEA